MRDHFLFRSSGFLATLRYRYSGFKMRFLVEILRNEEAVSAVEYAVMLAMVLLAIVGAIGSLGAQNGGMWGGIQDDLGEVGFIK